MSFYNTTYRPFLVGGGGGGGGGGRPPLAANFGLPEPIFALDQIFRDRPDIGQTPCEYLAHKGSLAMRL